MGLMAMARGADRVAQLGHTRFHPWQARNLRWNCSLLNAGQHSRKSSVSRAREPHDLWTSVAAVNDRDCSVDGPGACLAGWQGSRNADFTAARHPIAVINPARSILWRNEAP